MARFASTVVLLALLWPLGGCGGEAMVPAPVVSPQSPRETELPPPPSTSPGKSRPAGPVKVALLVPLSGVNAALGKSMLEAAQLALFTTGANQLTLIPRDTGGTPDGAAAAARSAIADGAQLLLGPLLASEVGAVRPVVQAAKINVIAFSTATQFAGGDIFLMGFLPRQEVVREVSFARERGLGRFAALAPNSPYGHLMADAMRAAVGTSGGSVADIEYFAPGGADLADAIQHLLPPAGAAPGNSAFDALVLPVGGSELAGVARQLRAAGLDNARVRLLGSGLWDDPSIAQEPALVGGWFAASPPASRSEFERHFQATYHHAPPRLASLAFDAAALAAVLANQGGPRPFSREAILNPSGFTGVDGLFRFTPQGLVQRGLAVLEVESQSFSVVSPAPQTFQDFSY